MGKGVGNEVLQQATINTIQYNTGLAWEDGRGQKPPILSRGAGHDPLREVLLLLRAAHHSALQEVLTPL